MSLINAKVGGLKTLGLPKGQQSFSVSMKNGRAGGDDLVQVAAVERILEQADELAVSHLESDGPSAWYDSWSQEHDRNGWGRDMDGHSFRSLRTRETKSFGTVVAESVGTPEMPEFPSLSPKTPTSFKLQDEHGFISTDISWADGQLTELKEVRDFPGQAREELNLKLNSNGTMTVQSSVEEKQGAG